MDQDRISDATLTDLEERLHRLAHARTKALAKPILDRLHFDQGQLAAQIPDPYFREKLSKAVIYAAQASGQVSNKAHWIHSMENEWHVFRTRVNKPLPVPATPSDAGTH